MSLKRDAMIKIKFVTAALCASVLLPAIANAQGTATIGLAPSISPSLVPACRALTYTPDTIVSLNPVSSRFHDFEATAHGQSGDVFPEQFVAEVIDLDIASSTTAIARAELLGTYQSICNALEIVATMHELDGDCYSVVGTKSAIGGVYNAEQYPGGVDFSVCTIEVSWPVSTLATKTKVVVQAWTPGFPEQGELTQVKVIGN